MDTNNDVVYTSSQVEAIIRIVSMLNLDNRIGLSSEGEDMRHKQQVTVNGVSRWLTGNNMQDIMNSYLEFCLQQGVVAPPIAQPVENHNVPLFGRYITNFNRIYKSKQQSLTKESRKRITEKHIIPKWNDIPLDKIKTSDIQLWFNALEEQGYSHETLLKIKNNMSPVFDAAIEDGYISRNPMKSTRLVIGGRETIHHKAVPKEKMTLIREAIPSINNIRIRRMLALMCNTGMRMEEILGLKWEDFDYNNNWIEIQRAVIHPNRNQPEIKEPKSSYSKRKIPLTNTLKEQLGITEMTGFVLNSNGKPLSFTEARNCIRTIQKMFDIKGYTAHDFRDTCATEWREAGIPTDIIARLLGHSKSDITESRYIKYRNEVFEGVRSLMEQKREQN